MLFLLSSFSCNDDSLGCVFMKFTKIFVFTWFEWSNKNSDLTISGNDLFSVEIVAFKFFSSWVLIFNDQFDFLISRDNEFFW